MRRSLFAPVLACLALCSSAAQAAPACELLKYAELPVTMIGRRPTIEAKIDGQSVRLMVDTGGFFSTLDAGEAKRLNIHKGELPARLHMKGLGGEATDLDVVRAKTFQVGPFVMAGADFLTTATGGFGQDVIGILGENVLSAYDVEFDLGGGMIRIFGTKGDCDHVPPTYWSKTYSMLSTEADVGIDNALIGEASVNGHKIRAVFDTGASASILSVRAAAKAGITPQSPGVRAAGVSTGYGKGQVTTWIAPLDSFAVGGEAINRTQMQMGALDLAEGADMLLGADFFLAHRVYISARRRRIWFTYSGGPVFSLRARPGAVDDQTPPAGSAPAQAADTPTDADGFSRRATAFLARGEIPQAIADLDHAVELEPKVEQHYLDRARARLANRQPILAMADIDQSLTLKPADPQALMIRGSLYLGQRDETRAKADFEAAIAAPTANPNIELAVGSAYERTDRFAEAVARYDHWIAGHPKDTAMDVALNARCWTRAEWNRDLDQALADCDRALKLRPKTAAYLDSRGLAYLRLGQLDKALADYDAALAIQPKGVWSLYARGLVKAKRGDQAGGDADMAAALALNRGLAIRAQRLGLAPAPPVAARPAG